MVDFGYVRDASWWNRPSTSGPKKIHRESETTPGASACGVVPLLDTEKPIPAEPGHPGRCRRCWPVLD